MGVFHQRVDVGRPDESEYETVDAIVDTGASFTSVPSSMLRRLGVVPHERRAFTMADGTTIERELGYTWIRLGERTGISPVVFGDDGGPVLLGAFTLEVLQLGVEPGHQRLVPVPAYLLATIVRGASVQLREHRAATCICMEGMT